MAVSGMGACRTRKGGANPSPRNINGVVAANMDVRSGSLPFQINPAKGYCNPQVTSAPKVILINDLPEMAEIKVNSKYLNPETTLPEVEIVEDPKPGAHDLEIKKLRPVG